jgi:hypothetical protein
VDGGIDTTAGAYAGRLGVAQDRHCNAVVPKRPVPCKWRTLGEAEVGNTRLSIDQTRNFSKLGRNAVERDKRVAFDVCQW